MDTRRSFFFTAGSLASGWRSAFAQRTPSRFGGIEVGLQSHCFRDLSLETILDTAAALGFGSLEISGSDHVEPSGIDREALRHWRLTVDLAVFREIRRKVEARGIVLRSYSQSVRTDWTEEETDRLFQMARMLGVGLITSSSNIGSAARLEPLAKRYRIRVAFHNHADIKPDEFATEEDFERGLAGRSEWLGINLDTGHYVAAGFDPVALLRRFHSRVYLLHLKDSKKNNGPQLNFGQGDTPLRDLLLLLQKEKWDIPGMIEHVVRDGEPVDAIRYDYAWTRRILGGVA
jgi:sugar phosphate isomerase/epimerase